jgi:hypothetical protein
MRRLPFVVLLFLLCLGTADAGKEPIWIARPDGRSPWLGANVRAYPTGTNCWPCLTGGLAAIEKGSGTYYWQSASPAGWYDLYANGYLIQDDVFLGIGSLTWAVGDTIYIVRAQVDTLYVRYAEGDTVRVQHAEIDTLYTIHADIDTLLFAYVLGGTAKADTLWAFKYLRSDDSLVVRGGTSILEGLLVGKTIGARGVTTDSLVVRKSVSIGPGPVKFQIPRGPTFPSSPDTAYLFVKTGGTWDSLFVYDKCNSIWRFTGAGDTIPLSLGLRGLRTDSLTVDVRATFTKVDVSDSLHVKGAHVDSLHATLKLIVPVFPTDPGDLLVGMMWYNTTAERLSYYDGAIRRLEREPD